MTIHVECENCLTDFRVRDDFAGEIVDCKECGAELHIPLDDRTDDNEWRDRPRRRRRHRSRRNPLALAGISFVSVLLVGVLFFALTQDDAEPVDEMQPAAEELASSSSSPTTSSPFQPPEQSLPARPSVVENGLFPLASVPVPRFPRLVSPYDRFPDGSVVYFVDLSSEHQRGTAPGFRMTMRVYLPAGQHKPRSIPCVLVAPAGTNLLRGNSIDAGDYHAETLPYVKAGMAVIFYSLDGDVADPENAAHSEFTEGYNKFKAAQAGIVNGRNALEFALARLPQVDPQRIFSAGHSSAGTLSLLLAQHEPRIKRCIAYAPATDVEERLREALIDPAMEQIFPDIKNFVARSSPDNHAGHLKCPVFLFHSVNDGNEPFSRTHRFYANLMATQAEVHLQRSVGGHYQSMIDAGIPQAISWLKTSGEPSNPSPSPSLAGNSGSTSRPSIPRPPQRPRGNPVVVFEVLGFSGTGDRTEIVRRLMAGIPWANASESFFDEKTSEVVVPVRGRSVSTGGAKSLLQSAGFQIGFSSYRGSGR